MGGSARRGVWGAGLAGLALAAAARLLLTRLPVLLCLADLLNRWDDASDYNVKLNKYLQGPFAPVEHEHFGLPMAVAEGAIPAGLEGLYVRVGPNPTKRTLSRGHHLFDGHGMIHSVRLANGSGVYSNQYVQTPRLELEDQYQRPVLLQVGEYRGLVGILKAAVLAPLLSRASGLPAEAQGTANTNVYLHAGRLYVGHEGSYPMEIQWRDDHSFNTLGYNTMGGQLDYPVTAHPKVDPGDGRLYFNGYNAVHEVDMKYGVYSEGKLQTYLPFKLAQKSFLHDMLITQHYVVFFESSVAFDAQGIVNGTFLKYNDQHRMRVGLFPKLANDSAAVRWFEAPGSLGTVHAMNAWEAGPDEVVVFAAGMQAFDSNVKELLPSYLHEFRLNLQTGTMTIKVVGPDHMVEFTRVHPKFLGRPSQFGYAGGFTAHADWFSGVVKFDLFSRNVVGAIVLPEGTLCGEPVPIPKPGPAGQQSDGVYLGFFVHRKGQSSGEWQLYDGETMSPQPVVRLTVGEHVPIGFHGEWIAQPDLLAHLARGRAA
eukprot:EG_transcript_5900